MKTIDAKAKQQVESILINIYEKDEVKKLTKVGMTD